MVSVCFSKCFQLGDNCIQNFHLRRYIVGYTVGNLVLRQRVSGAVKRDFRPHIQRYTSQNENFEYGYTHSNALLQFCLKLERCKLHNAARHPRKCDVINDVKLFPTVYRRIYCRKFMTLSNQKSRYKSKCIRIRFQTLLDAFHMHLELIYHNSESIQKGCFMFYVHSGCLERIQNILCILEVNEQFRKCLE